MEETQEIPFDNPVMTAIGATNKPHIMGLQPISRYDQDGEHWAKVPILILGKWLHRNGILNFTQNFVQKIKDALHAGVAGHDVALDPRHLSDRGALGWVKDLVVETLENGLQQVSALTKLTNWGVEAIDDQRFRYGSIEFHPDFQNRLAEAASSLSFDGEGCELIKLEEGELPIQARNIAQEETMPDNTTSAIVPENAISLEQFNLVQEQLRQVEKRLEAERSRSLSLEAMALRQFTDAILAKAEVYRDAEGRAHGKVVLEWAANVLSEKPIGDDSDPIKLEADPEISDVRAYFKRSIAWLLRNAPGTVPMSTPQTEPDTARKLSLDDHEKEDADARSEVLALFGMTVGKES